jgi:DNA-binding transcriptional MerR regulator
VKRPIRPASRTSNGYRWYGDREIRQLQQITAYRSYGVPVCDIRELLAGNNEYVHQQILRKRFTRLEAEIQDLRRQQQAQVAILEHAQALPQSTMNKQRWSDIMRSAGMSDADMQNWHSEFEAREPTAHQEFLESLNIGPDEIRKIRAWSGEHLASD